MSGGYHDELRARRIKAALRARGKVASGWPDDPPVWHRDYFGEWVADDESERLEPDGADGS